MKIKIIELENLIRKVLSTKYSKSDIDMMLPIIMFAELAGVKSHGITRIPAIVNKIPKSKPKIINKTKTSKIIDGGGNPGMLLGGMACEAVIKMGKKFGIGIM